MPYAKTDPVDLGTRSEVFLQLKTIKAIGIPVAAAWAVSVTVALAGSAEARPAAAGAALGLGILWLVIIVSPLGRRTLSPGMRLALVLWPGLAFVTVGAFLLIAPTGGHLWTALGALSLVALLAGPAVVAMVGRREMKKTGKTQLETK